MNRKKIVILGGYGRVGQCVARLLLDYTEAEVVIAGRHQKEAEELAGKLNRELTSQRVSGVYADAAHPSSLAEAFAGNDMVLVTAPLTTHVKKIARAALDAGIDYLDTIPSPDALTALNGMKPEIVRAKRCFITQAGGIFGLPAVLVRRAAAYFQPTKNIEAKYKCAMVGMALRPAGKRTRQDGATSTIYHDGRWRSPHPSAGLQIDFGSPFGRQECYPVPAAEMTPLPRMLGLEALGVYASFDLAAFCRAAQSSKAPAIALVTEASGERHNKGLAVRIVAEHNDAFYFTSAGIAACLLQYIDGSIRKPGVWLIGDVVDPLRIMKDIEMMEIIIQTRVTYGQNSYQRACGWLATLEGA